MTQYPVIFDGHAYCFPDVRGSMGWASPEAKRVHVQKSMANHHIQPWRARDHAPGSTSTLMDDAKWPGDDALRDVNFRPTTHGRYEWTVDGEDYVKQYFPPSIADMAYPPENLIAEMDYANVTGTLLHRNPYLGIGNDFIADCVEKFPGRIFGLAHAPEWRVEDDPEAAARTVEEAVRDRGLSGLQFLTSQLHLYGKNPDWAGGGFTPFWDGVARLGVPVFFSFGINEPKREPVVDHYFLELQRLTKWMEQYPDTPVVMTHGFMWRLFADQGKFQLPDELWRPFENPNLSLQLLFAIGLGDTWDFPLPQGIPLIKELVQHIGADRLIWGTDMPIVMRHWTYQQNIDFIVKYCDFLSKEDLALIMGGTIKRLLGLG
ncbi:MAG: amidohydrolase [Chloroflexi bacterium]|nr:amidohydrolase [Chloroflexota bacterium]MCI0804095.1 amidohydrolase [Chloroflexota bacterium]MCI0808612.1 amidohydrolase [Chloroflexota bacterium]